MAISIGKAWDDTRGILGRDGKLIASVAAALLLLPTALLSLVAPQTASMAAEAEAAQGTALWLQLVVLIVTQIGVLALSVIALRPGASVGEAIATGAKRVFPVLGALLLYVVPMLFLFGIVVGAAVGGETPEAMLANLRAAGGGVLLVMLLWAVAMLYLGLRFFFVPAVAVGEGAGPVAMLKRSWALTRGETLRLLAFLMLWLVLAIVVSMALGAVFGTLVALTLGAPEPFSVAALAGGLVGGVVNAIVMSVYALMIARLYAQKVTIDSVPNVEDIFA